MSLDSGSEEHKPSKFSSIQMHTNLKKLKIKVNFLAKRIVFSRFALARNTLICCHTLINEDL